MVSRPESRKEVSLGDVAYELAGSVNPLVTPNQLFTEYSMPAFDNRKKATVVPGSAMLSARRRIIEPCVLVNKLNVRKRRVWSVLHPEENAVSSFEFVPLASSVLDLEFLQYVALSDEFTAFLEAHTSGTSNSQKRVSANVILSYLLQLPSLTEQRAIAEVLSRFDEHLANLDELIRKKKAIRDGALEGLMSRDLRLDGYNMPWAVRSLDEIAHSRRELSTGDPMDMDVELENLLPGEGQVVGDTSVRTAASFIFRPGDVLFGRLRPYLKKYWLATCSGLRSGEIWALAAKDGIDPRFLFHLVRTQRFLDAAGKTMGTKMPRADWSLLKTESFEVPEVDEQRAIAEVLSGMDEEIRLLAEERAKVERLKLGAMDDLLTGRVRLPLEEEAA